jgi:hypothetical protein
VEIKEILAIMVLEKKIYTVISSNYFLIFLIFFVLFLLIIFSSSFPLFLF